MGSAVSSFVDKAKGGFEDAVDSVKKNPLSLAYPLMGGVDGLGGVGSTAYAGLLAGKRVLQDQKDQANGMVDKEKARLEAARLKMLRGRPIDADLTDIVRQRTRRGRADTILTAGQSLGSTPTGKTLLGM